MNFCPSIHTLTLLLDDTLTEPEVGSVRGHVSSCCRCQSTLDDLSEDLELRQMLVRVVSSRTADDGPALRRVLETLRVTPVAVDDETEVLGGLLAPVFGPAENSDEIGVLGPYRVLEEIGRGGMGIVYRALDTVLQRTVALKLLRPELGGPAGRRRLVREAQLAARFRHDHVVSVITVVDPPDGLPYLVMEHLSGPTLAARIHGASGLSPREAAGIAAGIAEGLAAAHAAGLVHRDVKPGNVLFDAATGRDKLTDFGLARASAASAATTRESNWAGTPAYMSPEQVRGEAEPDGRSDVYGLGATLYEALTGEPPFRGAQHMILHQVLHEEPRPPRSLNDRIPRDLETVCLKALAKEPGRRYPTAGAMAEDLHRFLQGKPVQARRVGRVGRLVRWGRRNPRVAVLAAGLAVAVLAGLSGVYREWSQAEAYRARAEIERDQARRDFRRAREAVDHYLTDVSDNPELKSQNFEPLRHTLLRTARDFYEQFVAEHPDDPGLTAELGRAHGRLGAIAAELESQPASVPHYRAKVAIFQRLHEQDPTDPGYRDELADSHLQLGWGGMFGISSVDPEAEYAAARDLWYGLHAEYPDSLPYALQLSRAHANLGHLEQYSRGRPADAEPHYRASREILDELMKKHSGDEKCRAALTGLLHRFGELLGKEGRLSQGRECLRECVEVQKGLVRDFPTNALYQGRLANDLIALGELLERSGEWSEAGRAWRESLTHVEAVLRTHPSVCLYRQLQGEIHNCLGRLGRYGLMPHDEALTHLRKAVEVQEKLFCEDVRVGERWYELSNSYDDLLRHWIGAGRPEQVLIESEQAGNRLRTLLEGMDSKCADLNNAFRWSFHGWRGQALRVMGRDAEAVRELGLALQLSTGKDRPPAQQKRDLAQAVLVARNGDPGRAVSVADSLAATPGDGGLMYEAAAVYAVAAAAEKSAAAEQYARRAVELLGRARDADFPAAGGPRVLLEVDHAFDPLRGRADYQAFLKSCPVVSR